MKKGLVYETKINIYDAPKGTLVKVYKSTVGVDTFKQDFDKATMRAIWACFILYRELCFNFIDNNKSKRLEYERIFDREKGLAKGCLSEEYVNLLVNNTYKGF